MRAGPRPVLDAVSRAIIEQLQEDGRRSYARIAGAVGLSEAAVRQRVQRLLDAGVMQVVAVTAEGTRVTRSHVEHLLHQFVATRPRTPEDRFADAASLFRKATFSETCPTFFTVPGYVEHLVDRS